MALKAFHEHRFSRGRNTHDTDVPQSLFFFFSEDEVEHTEDLK